MTYKEPLTTTTQPGLITLAGDLAGTATTPKVVNITGAAGVATVTASTKLNFGTNPSTSGLINLPNNSSIEARNAANTADLVIATLDSGNTLTIGNTTSAVNVTAGSNINISSASNTNAGVNITSGSTAAINFLPGGVGKAGITTSGTQIGSATQALGGGVLVVGITNATTIPTSLLSGTGSGLIMYSHNGQLEIDGYGINFHNLSQTVGLSQTTAATDVATQNMTITSQAPFASATTNKSASSVVVNFPPPVSGGTEGGFVVERGGVFYGSIAGGNNSPSTRAALFLGVGMTPGAFNHCLYSDGAAVTQLNVPTSGVIQAVTNGAGFAWTANARNTQFNNSSIDVGGAAGAIGLTATTVNPTTNPTSGVVIYSEVSTFCLKTRDGYGTTTALGYSPLGTVDAHAQKILKFIYYGKITTTGGTLAVSIPLATSSTSCALTTTVVARITSAGGGTTAVDTFVDGSTTTWKNIAGTVSQVGSAGLTTAQSDTSLNTSALTYAGSGTNILVTFTGNATSSTLGTLDVTLTFVQTIT